MSAPAFIVGPEQTRIPITGDVLVLNARGTAMPPGSVAPYAIVFGDASGGADGDGLAHAGTHHAGAGDALDLASLGGTLGPTHGGTGLATIPAGAIPFGSSLDVIAALAIGANGQFLKVVAGLPAWSAIAAADITSGQLDKARQHAATLYGDAAVTVLSDTDALTILGRAKVFSTTSDSAMFAHFDHATSTNYGLRQNQNGTTVVNCPTGQSITFAINNSTIWSITSSGHLVAATDATRDIGASGASRPRDLFLSRNLALGGVLTSTQPAGTPPFVVASDAMVANLNAAKLGGQDSAYHLALANATGTLATVRGGTGADGSALPASRALISPTGGGTAAFRALVTADLPADVALLSGAGRFTGAISGTGVAGVRMGTIGGLGGFYIDTGGDGWSVFGDANDLHFEHDSGLALLLSADGLGGGSFGGMSSVGVSTEYLVNATPVVGARKTGWATATGTATRTTFDTATVTLVQLAQRVKALIDDLHATAGHGLIGT
jgi:hypothetical protein